MTDIFGDFATHGLQYRFNAGVPDQITQRITKWQQANRTRWDAFYVQDQWTRNRLTLQGALRYEHAWSFFPEGLNGLLTDSVFGGPARTLPRAEGVTGYNDIAPRMGMAYDIFGNGKTAIKVNLSKYWQYAANDGVYIGTNPASTFAQTANRAWTDNGNFSPDCDLQNPLAQDNRASGGDFCGALDNQNFFRFRQDGSCAEHGHAESTRRCSVAGASVRTTGSSAPRSSRSCCRACPPRSATAAARGGTSPSPTTWPSGPRTSTPTRSPHRPTRVLPTSGQPVSYILQEQPHCIRRGRQLPDARQQLRRRDGVLAGRGNDGECADEPRPHPAGRLHHAARALAISATWPPRCPRSTRRSVRYS